MTTKKIKKNAIKCIHCGSIIESKHVHDFKWCSCQTVFVDGGHDYLRRGFKNSHDDYIDMSEYEDVEVPDDEENDQEYEDWSWLYEKEEV